MSRVGKMPVEIPEGVTVSLVDRVLTVRGPQGELVLNIPDGIEIEVGEKEIVVSRVDEKTKSKALHGTIRSLINNMVIGVTVGFVKELEIHGVGYKAALEGDRLVLYLGYNHPIYVNIPEDLSVEVPSATLIIIKGIDKQKVGQFAAQVRAIKKPDVYKGKGIRYKGEIIRKKVVKAGLT